MASVPSYREILIDGLWLNNRVLVALLGLCPLLAVSNSVVNAIALGLATISAMISSFGIVSLVRRLVPHELRLPVYVLVIAANVTIIDLLMSTYFHDLYQVLGIFIPLIVTNCAIIGRVETFASKQSFDRAVLDGFSTGLGFMAVLMVLGALREIIGTGALLNHADLLFGAAAKSWKLEVFSAQEGCLSAILPPGAFIGLGLLVAAKNAFHMRANGRLRSPVPGEAHFRGRRDE